MSLISNMLSPDKNALLHSQSVQAMVHEKITQAGGWLSFAHYMDLVLYAPGLGYYSSGSVKLGSSGDFVTAPEISSLFGRTLARQALQILQHIESADILEFGAGSGKLAVDMLQELEKLDVLPEKYFILELSAELMERQQALFAQAIPHLLERIEWLTQLPDRFTGLVVANEVLDAMPVHLIVWRDGAIFERGVTWRNDQLVWQDRPIQDTELQFLANRLTDILNPNHSASYCYVSEIHLAAAGFIRSLARLLKQGVILLIDYGFGEREYYHPQRDQGTLMCHYRHHAHGDPFFLPGLQDITSHVDFSAITQVANASGLQFIGFTTQAHFLINNRITDLLAQVSTENSSDYLPLSNQLQKLVSPAEMGELFKVIAFGKDFTAPLSGFTVGNMTRLL